jgi:hypothetical protein
MQLVGIPILLAVISSVNAGTSQALIKGITKNVVPAATFIDNSQALWVAGPVSNSVTPGYNLVKVDSKKTVVFNKAIPLSSTTAINGQASAITGIGSTIVVCGSETYSISGTNPMGAIVRGYNTAGALLWTTKIVAPTFQENGATSYVSGCSSMVTSAADNKVYTVGASLMDISKSAYGYSVSRIDISTGKVDWTTNYLTPNSDGGSPANGLLVGDGSLWVSGGLGIMKFSCSTGAIVPSSILPSVASITTLALTDGNVIASDFNNIFSINPTTLAQNWKITNVSGVQKQGPAASTLWFARTLATSGDPSDWDVEVGVISLTTKAVLWRKTFNSGTKMGDQLVGVRMDGNIISLLINGKSKGGLFNMFTVDSIRLVKYSHLTKGLVSQMETKSIGTAAQYVASTSMAWAVTYTGDGIFFAETSAAFDEDLNTSNVEPAGSDNAPYIGIGVGVGALVLVIVAVVIIRRRRHVGEPTPSESKV